jgi:hypothetical protein
MIKSGYHCSKKSSRTISGTGRLRGRAAKMVARNVKEPAEMLFKI